MNRSSSRSFVVVALTACSLAALGSIGCGSSDSSGSAADSTALDDATDVSSTESHVESLGTAVAGGSGSGTMELSLATYGELAGNPNANGGVAPQDVGDAAKSFFTPASCLTVTNDAKSSTVTYAFASCSGPYGLAKLTGTVAVGYTSPSASELKLTFNSTNFQVNNATVSSWSASADITSNGASRTMIWTGMYTGTTARGTAFTHSSSRTVTWMTGGTCIGETGSSDGQVGSLKVQVDVKNFQVCAGQCPASGSEITVNDETDGKTYDLTYGNDTATYTNAADEMYNFKPLCAD